MEALTISLMGFGAILILAFLRFPLALAMGLVGVVGFGELTGYRAAISNLGRLVMDLGQSYSLSVLPLFILMGLLVEKEVWQSNFTELHMLFLVIKKVAWRCQLLLLVECSLQFRVHPLLQQPQCQK